MSIRGACVDRGRLLVQESSATRVEGRTTFVPVAGEWFKCRLFLTGSPNERDAQSAHDKAVSRPQVLTPLRDRAGSIITFHGDYRMEIRSRQLGKAVWRLTGEPEPLRRRRRLIGWLLDVERVVERVYDDLLDQNVPDIDGSD